jgi:hypothetical protein
MEAFLQLEKIYVKGRLKRKLYASGVLTWKSWLSEANVTNKQIRLHVLKN